jgi:hypothetical protein
MADLSETLMSRLEEAVRPIERTEPILSTTGTRAALASLSMRTQALEEAVRELAAALQAIAESDRQESFRS